jgi:hypothetical protein
LPPDDDELETYLKLHSERFMEPWRVRLTHVYLSDDQRGASAEADAHRLLGQLRTSRIEPEAGPALGDPFLLGHRLPWQTRQRLQKSFGGAFAAAVAELEPGIWSEPIRSSYGWHLVWAYEIREPTVPVLAAVRDHVRRDVLEDRREWRVQQTLKALRARYSIQVESPVIGNAGRIPVGNNG